MHFPKAARLTLQGLFKVPPEFFDELEKVDFAAIQAGLVETIKQFQTELPVLSARLSSIERGILDLKMGQVQIITAIEAIAESLHIQAGGLPTELSTAGTAWEGKEEVTKLLEAQGDLL